MHDASASHISISFLDSLHISRTDLCSLSSFVFKMKLKDITEEKAKEILDFLAKEAGFDDIHYFTLSSSNMHRIKRLCAFSSYFPYGCAIICGQFNPQQINYAFIESTSRQANYKAALKKILTASMNGATVKAGCNVQILFLKPYTALEQILIEMDMKVS